MKAGHDDHTTSKKLNAADVEQKLQLQVENWRKKLLDVGNRNPLINCSLESNRGALPILYPDCEVVWRKLAADNEAGTAALRFPWRRDLVPPPKVRPVAGDGKLSRVAGTTQRLLLEDEKFDASTNATAPADEPADAEKADSSE